MKHTSVHAFCLLLGSLAATVVPAAGSSAFRITEPPMVAQDLDDNSESLKRDLAERAEDLYRRRILVDMRGQAKETVDILQQFKEVHSGYLSVRDSLFDSGVGKRIAADEAAFLSFRSQLTPPVATMVELDTKVERAERFAAQLEVEVDAPSPYRSVTGAERDELAALKFWAAESLADAQARASLIRSLVADVAEKPIDGELASLPTLRDALESYDAKLATINATAAEPIEAWAIRAAAVQRALGEAIQRRERVEHELARANIEAEVAQRMERAEAERRLARAEQKLAELRADVEREKQVSDAELRRRVKELEQDLKDKDSAVESEVERRIEMRIKAREKSEAQLAADLDAKDAEIRRLKAESATQLATAAEKVRQLESQLVRRELPAEVRGRVALLTTPGYWRPRVVENGRGLDGEARYDSVEKVPYSLADLIGCGATDKGDGAIYILYAIMACNCNDRPKMAAKWQLGYYYTHPRWTDVDMKKEFVKSAESKALYHTMEQLNEYLREWGPELVREGLLQP